MAAGVARPRPATPGTDDLLVAAALALLTILSRLPFRGAILYHWDSINFALGLREFNVAASQPHVPGYLLYVLLGRAVNALFGDAQRALVAISTVSSGLAVAALYGLGRDLFDRATGIAAALLLASSPLFWFYGAIALPHSLDAFMAIAVVWCLYRLRSGARAMVLPAALWLGVAGGLRPQTQVFLAPLALYAAWHLDWRRCALGLVVLVVVDLLWLVPLVELSGGLGAYVATARAYDQSFTNTTSIFADGGWSGLTRNLVKLGMYTLYGLGAALALAVLAPAWRGARPGGWRRLGRDVRVHVLLLWSLPCLAFYTLIHMGQQGLVFLFLPAVLLVIARGLCGGAAPRRAWRPVAVGLAVAANAALFVAAPTFPLGGDRPKLLTAETLRRHDAFYRDRFTALTARFGPGEVLILSNTWRFPQYYLPGYALQGYGVVSRWERGEGEPTRRDATWVDPGALGVAAGPDGRTRVVLFEDDLARYNVTPQRVLPIPSDDGQRLAVMALAPGERLYLGPDGFGVVAHAGERPGDTVDAPR